MKSVMIVAALGAALCLAAPMAASAATTVANPAKGMSDVQLYCSFFSWTAKCAASKPTAVAAPVAKTAAVPMVKPAKATFKTMACVKAEPGKGHLYDCTWK